MNLLIKYASRGRRDLFLKTMDNVLETINGNNYQIIISCDIDDIQMNHPDTIEAVNKYPNSSIYFGRPISKVAAINRDFEYANEWDWLLNLSDDFKFVQKDWNIEMLKSIKSEWGESLDFFSHFNDFYVGDKLPTMAIMGKDFYNRFGYIYNDTYFSVSCDSEQFYVAQMLGRYKYFSEVYFHHIHPGNIAGMPNDETYRKNNPLGELDTVNYFERMSHGFYIDDPIYMPEEVKYYMDKRLKKNL